MLEGSQIALVRSYNHQRDKLISYHDSDIVTDFRFVLCDIQMSNELNESTPKGYIVDFTNAGRGAN